METGAGRAINLAAVSLLGFNLSSDIAPTLEKSVDDVVSPAITMTTEGVIRIPDTPGLGFEVLPEFIKAYQCGEGWQSNVITYSKRKERIVAPVRNSRVNDLTKEG